MSAQVPITLNRIASDLVDINIMPHLNGADARQFAAASKGARKRTHYQLEEGCLASSQLLDTYVFSQDSQDGERTPKIQRRANSLIGKVSHLIGGKAALRQVENPIHVEGQLILSDNWAHCKVIGLFPFFKAMTEARGLLDRVSKLRTNWDKYKEMRAWIKAHPKQVGRLKELNVIRLLDSQVCSVVQPTFFPLRGKVYNLVPSEIRYFKGLKRLSFCNNLLTYLPEKINKLALREMNLDCNAFCEMPPIVPSLRKLSLVGNRVKIPVDNIEKYISDYICMGGDYLVISLNGSYITELDGRDEESYTVHIELREGNTLITVERKIEATQVLEEDLSKTDLFA